MRISMRSHIVHLVGKIRWQAIPFLPGMVINSGSLTTTKRQRHGRLTPTANVRHDLQIQKMLNEN